MHRPPGWYWIKRTSDEPWQPAHWGRCTAYPGDGYRWRMMAARESGMTTEQAAAIFGRERTAVTHARDNLPGWLEEDAELRRIKATLDNALRGEQ